MALTILNNIAAIAAENQLNITSNSLNSTLEQLSSGSRINSGADDPAGLAIANGLAANIAALTQSSSNATDGVGELQVADGALSQVTTLLDRAVTLATESATGTVSNSQRGALDAEYQSIKAEINSIGSTTNFNGGQVFTNNTLNVFLSDGSVSGSSTIGVSTGLLSSTSLSIGGTPATATLAEAVATPAARATNVLTGGTFVGSTQANSLLTASTQFNALTNASATFTAGTINLATQATQALTGATTWAGSTKGTSVNTFNGTAVGNNDTVLVGGTTYTFKTALTGAANEVLIGLTGDTTALANLQKAINLSGIAGTDYGTGTAINAGVVASGASATNLTVTSKVNGLAAPVFTYTNVSANGAAATQVQTAGLVGTEITAGGQNYTFVTNLSTNVGSTQNEVLYTGVVANDLLALKQAINNGPAGTGSGTAYSTGTLANTNVTAGTIGGGILTIAANTNGVGGTVGGAIAQNTAGGTLGSFATQVNGTAGSTVQVGNQTYTFVTALGTGAGATTNEILGSGGATAEIANLVAAINYTSANSGAYSYANSVANANASAAVLNAGSTATITARLAGTGIQGNGTGNFVGVGGTAGTFTNAAAVATTDLAGGTAASVVHIGNQDYTFVNAAQFPTAAPYSVLINTTAAGTAAQILGSLTNLADAVNGTGTPGTNPAVDNYSSATQNTYALAGTATAGTGNTSSLNFTAQVNGLGSAANGGTGNYTVSTTTGTTNGFAAGLFANGTTGDTLTVGGHQYNFVTALSTNTGGTADEVVAGTSVAQDLLNLQMAVNNGPTGTGSGTNYSTGTAANNSATVTGTTGTTATFQAISQGTGGNAITTAITGGIGNFLTTNFTGGSSLQSVGGPAVAGDTVTVGSTQYRFVTAITAFSLANDVLVGAGTGAASETASLTNLAAAVNGATGEGVTYALGTTANASATATLVANPNSGPVNQIRFTALTGGTAGNAIASGSTGGDNIFSGALFTGGGTATNDLLTTADATAALTLINTAVAQVASLRGNIGATVNRLQAATSVITNQTQNLTSAENDVTAANIPSTVASLSQYSILEQTGVSALAQANQQQQLVLKLLQ
jgi:flagellin